VFKKHAAAIGWTTPRLKEHLRSWYSLFRHLGWMRSNWGRMWLATYGGHRVGRLLGSLSYLVFFL